MSKRARRESTPAPEPAPIAPVVETDPEDIFADPPGVTTQVLSETIPTRVSPGRLVAGTPSDHVLEDAMYRWRLRADDVLGWSRGESSVVVVTKGGAKLRWPEERRRKVTAAEKGRPVEHPHVYPEGYLRRESGHD